MRKPANVVPVGTAGLLHCMRAAVPSGVPSEALPCESRSNHVEALWKRQTAAGRNRYGRSIARRADQATGGSRRQQLLAPYKQEVARSSRAPPISAGPLRKRNLSHLIGGRHVSEWCRGSVVEARRATRAAAGSLRHLNGVPSRPASLRSVASGPAHGPHLATVFTQRARVLPTLLSLARRGPSVSSCAPG